MTVALPFARVGALLDAHRQRTPHKTALVDVERNLSIDFTELAQYVDALARQLQRANVTRGARVVLAGSEGIEKLLLWLALWRLRAIVCPLDVAFLGAHGAQRVFDRIDPAFVLIAEHADETVLPTSSARIVRFGAWPANADADVDTNVDDPQAQLRFVTTPLATASNHDDDTPLPDTDEPGGIDEIAAMCCTSGTTGVPKVVVYDHASYWYNGLDTIDLLALTADDRTLEYRSFDWYSAQILSLIPFLQLGSTLCVARSFSRSRFAQWIATHRVSVSAGVPTVLNLLLEAPVDIEGGKLASLRAITCSTAPLSTVQWARFEAHYGIRVLNLYGSSEAGWMCGNRYTRRKFGTVGYPVGHIGFSVVDPNGAPCAPGTPGQVVVAGEKLALGLLNDAHRIEPIRGAPLATRDVASIDTQGFVVVSGRMDDLIIRGGVKVLPQEIEDLLLEHPAVQDAVAVGVPDPIYGQEPVCFVVPHPGMKIEIAELVTLCRAKLPREKQPRQIYLVNELPRNARGKILRDALRREWWTFTHSGKP
ncbi:long-chain fatty acid--CoA ligase [Paraburkholderia sp. Ac-20342]|uniref:class I adenylate-forming enzyme family protein n=1 Tax=Paraburkholderia sp. Ac-20342 TaxID=2703889 RepID=UPI00197F5397|nr:fatty acid--CoA ligase family protein [Paraburkholderia sp. Ac-20342]MBN3850520.1 long-chain fatty acid--CoA ligase [Paraburkholderia sp. Ac-20342]